MAALKVACLALLSGVYWVGDLVGSTAGQRAYPWAAMMAGRMVLPLAVAMAESSGNYWAAC